MIWAESAGVASYGYFVVSSCPELNGRFEICKGDATEFTAKMQALAGEYLDMQATPKEIQFTSTDKQ